MFMILNLSKLESPEFHSLRMRKTVLQLSGERTVENQLAGDPVTTICLIQSQQSFCFVTI